MEENNLNIAKSAVKEALRLGASKADAIAIQSTNTSTSVRLGKIEGVERAESRDLGLRVFLECKEGYKTAIISTNNLLKDNITKTAEQVIEVAKNTTPDNSYMIADEEQLCKNSKNLELFDDNNSTSIEEIQEWAMECESASLGVKGVTNSEGANAGFDETEYAFVTSNNFAKSYKTSGFTFSTSVIAGEGTEMQTDYDYSFARYKKDLLNPSDIGKNAAQYAVKKLNSKKLKTQKLPIIFDKRVSKSLLANLAASINGQAVHKGSSFLSDSIDKQIFPKNINIIDDPQILRGISSQPFDAEGIEGKKAYLVKNGVLKNWITDLRSAKKLGTQTIGRASRGLGGHPHPSSTNMYMENGEKSFEDLISEIDKGLYLTDIFGMGINTVNGDYSQGASGFWIENGEVQYPVSEITIAGHLSEMFKNMEIANDLELRYSKNAPTIRIDGMTVAGR